MFSGELGMFHPKPIFSHKCLIIDYFYPQTFSFYHCTRSSTYGQVSGTWLNGCENGAYGLSQSFYMKSDT